MDFSELSKERFSVRKFSDRPIPRETLEEILEAGRGQPMDGRRQGVAPEARAR